MKSVLAILLTLTPLAAQASLFDDMRNNTPSPQVTMIEGKIKSLKVGGSSITVQIVQKQGGQVVTHSLGICDESSSDNDSHFQSEEMRAANYNQRVQSLREASISHKNVVIGYRGPWSPCLESVEVAGD